MQPPYQYPNTTKYLGRLEPTQAAHGSNYETTEQVYINPYLNDPYELPSLPPPPPSKSRKGLIMVVIALLCLTISSTSLFVGYVFIRPELARQTKVTATITDTPSPAPVPYMSSDIINAFEHAHLPVYYASYQELSGNKIGMPVQVPYDTSDVMGFEMGPGDYVSLDLAVFPNDFQARDDAYYINSDPDPHHMNAAYSVHRCLLLYVSGLDKQAQPYMDVMLTACT